MYVCVECGRIWVETRLAGALFISLPSENVRIKGSREDRGRGDAGDTKRQEMNWPSKGQAICRKCHIEFFLSATKETSACGLIANISSNKLYQSGPLLFYSNVITLTCAFT